MAGSSPINVPVRSISLPSRLLPNSIEAELNELKTFSTTNHADHGEAICTGFTRLAELYNNIEEIIQSQKALHHQQNIKLVEEALDDSVGLLDACGDARDLIMMMKEQVQELQSALRRRGGDSSCIQSTIHEYISFRKKLIKKIAKSLKALKKLDANYTNICSLPVKVLMVVKALRESNAIAISMFRSLLCFLSMPPVMKTKATGGWSLISKLMPERRCGQKLLNEVGIVDFTLSTLQVQGKVNGKNEAKINIDAQIQVIRRLETLCATIKGLEQVRSISLPSRVHPTSVKLETALNHLKAWKTSSASSSGETIQIGLIGLADLYNCVQEMVNSPQTKQKLVHYQNGKLVEEALDESITFLDTCGKGRDILFTMKEHVQSLQSALRRKRGDSSIETEVASYISCRKKVRKEVVKCLGDLKKMETKFGSSAVLSVSDVDHHLLMVVKVLREASSITIAVFQSLLLFLSMPSTKTRIGGWSKISKLISTRLMSSGKEERVMNEVGSVDVAVNSIKIGDGMALAEVQMLQRMLKSLDSSIDGLEAGLDCIFKCLVQNRVIFLNIITP
ncbi:hypothetical protein CCACVL1_27051 [Corchorus capsularis]|uniref:Uncharacterized protein n=1 Tax=Corchorus capsularis TaxID=210143 RepID=A0A1R3GCA8_COCAP|nr:hypothetical protein CCACVL1_27051 [Corchorus capsularis]